mmetsp:Transcript_103469/g.270141  ORF Transcript_103469/g.270141 Transcript_103469/m.270141 type:complete len:288 (+) Transcript_103469:1979-2842(+)
MPRRRLRHAVLPGRMQLLRGAPGRDGDHRHPDRDRAHDGRGPRAEDGPPLGAGLRGLPRRLGGVGPRVGGAALRQGNRRGPRADQHPHQPRGGLRGRGRVRAPALEGPLPGGPLRGDGGPREDDADAGDLHPLRRLRAEAGGRRHLLQEGVVPAPRRGRGLWLAGRDREGPRGDGHHPRHGRDGGVAERREGATHDRQGQAREEHHAEDAQPQALQVRLCHWRGARGAGCRDGESGRGRGGAGEFRLRVLGEHQGGQLQHAAGDAEERSGLSPSGLAEVAGAHEGTS